MSAHPLGHLKIKDLAKIELHFTEWKTLKCSPIYAPSFQPKFERTLIQENTV